MEKRRLQEMLPGQKNISKIKIWEKEPTVGDSGNAYEKGINLNTQE